MRPSFRSITSATLTAASRPSTAATAPSSTSTSAPATTPRPSTAREERDSNPRARTISRRQLTMSLSLTMSLRRTTSQRRTTSPSPITGRNRFKARARSVSAKTNSGIFRRNSCNRFSQVKPTLTLTPVISTTVVLCQATCDAMQPFFNLHYKPMSRMVT